MTRFSSGFVRKCLLPFVHQRASRLKTRWFSSKPENLRDGISIQLSKTKNSRERIQFGVSFTINRNSVPDNFELFGDSIHSISGTMTKRKFLTHSGIIPPFPDVTNKTTKSTSSQDTDGLTDPGSEPDSKRSFPSKLLSLIRSYEKKDRNDEDYEETIDELVDLFNHMIALYSRHGLLLGDTEKAEEITSAENSTTKWGSVESRKKKGKRGNKDKNSDDLRIQQSSTSQQQQDEALVFIAILRIFTTISSDSKMIDEDQALIISLGAELCLSISQHIKVDKESGACNLAEYELLAQSGKAILSGLVDVMNMVQNDMRSSSKFRKGGNCLTLLDIYEDTHVQILASSIKLACSLISLFTTKLSRSTALIEDLNAVAWKMLTIDNDSIQESTARLLSILPLAGGIDRKTPSEIWNAQIQNTLTALSTVLQTVAPLTQSNISTPESNGTLDKFLAQWIDVMRRDIPDEASRLRCFYRLSRGLTKVFEFFLLQDGMGRFQSNAILVDAQLDLKMVLSVVESLVSFPLSAETIFYRTKRRLRDEKLDNGLLSPRIIATEVANHIKLLGHDILDSMLATVGGPVLMPFARRILRISYASILTSSSGSVRKVMDPTSAVQLEGKKRRWLHLSIASRAVAVRTFGNSVAAFGCDYKSSSHGHSKSSSTNFFIASTDSEKAITLVVGCLVEQVGRNKFQAGDCDDDWGTNQERVDLIFASATCLNMVLVSCGEFLAIPIRSLIESVVVNALSQMCGTKQPSVQLLSWSLAKVSLLRLASTCVTTPWQDGASSALVELLMSAANNLKNDVDGEVSLTARSALRICETIGVPRAPALTYITRAVSTNDGLNADLGPNATTTDATSLAKNIESARNETMKARKRMEEIELAKKRKAEEKREREEKENREKAAKRQKALKEKAEKAQKAAAVKKSTIESSDDIKMEDVDGAKPSTKVENPSPTTESNTEQKPEKVTNEKNVETKSVEIKETPKEEKMETNETVDGDMNNDSDDDAFPEIFDGGPDSDDE